MKFRIRKFQVRFYKLQIIYTCKKISCPWGTRTQPIQGPKSRVFPIILRGNRVYYKDFTLYQYFLFVLERKTGLEPATFSLEG